MGAFEHALKYAKEREQFGKPIASIAVNPGPISQNISVNLTACQCMMYQLSQLNLLMLKPHC